jgi:alkylation response protein AidB-like acyl-CoA dehydrogenase
MSSTKNSWVSQGESVAHEVLARHAADVDRQGRWPAESVAALCEAGLMGLTVPLACGGAEEGPRTFVAVMRLLAEQCASTAMIYLMHVCATQMIAAARQFPQRDDILRKIAGGRHLSTLAVSEKGSRSHFWAAVSQAVIEGNTHLLSADKSYVTSASHAHSYIVPTRGAGLNEATATTVYYVPREVPGIKTTGAWNGLGLRGNASAPMRFENVAVPATYRLSGEGEGFAFMNDSAIAWFLLGSAAVSVGIARAATEATRQHVLASRLEHLGQSLAALPTVRARLAQMQIAVDVQQAFLDHAASLLETPGPTTALTVLESKAVAAETALQVTDQAMRACGGAAFGRQLSVERNFRDARAAAIMAPTTDVLHDFVGRKLLEMPLL